MAKNRQISAQEPRQLPVKQQIIEQQLGTLNTHIHYASPGTASNRHLPDSA
jgi:hypothetical protein